MFINKTDLIRAIRAEELEQITDGDDSITDYGIDVALSEMRSYLKSHFNVAQIFAATGTDRHSLLLNFGCDIAIYIIVSAALPGQNLEDRRLRYKRAIDWLQKVSKGEVATDLPVLIPASQNTTRGAYANKHTKRNNYY